MKALTLMVLVLSAGAAGADRSCALSQFGSSSPSTLLLKGNGDARSAAILVDGRTRLFDCPNLQKDLRNECYGTTESPYLTPTQLNIVGGDPEAGGIVIVTTRNKNFNKNSHIGYARRHTSVRVFEVRSCDPD